MCVVALPLSICGVAAAYASTLNSHLAARFETVAGVLVVVGLIVLGSCLPVYQ